MVTFTNETVEHTVAVGERTVVLVARETTVSIGFPTGAAAWTYVRPQQAYLANGRPTVIRDYVMIARLAALLLTILATVRRRKID